MKLLTSGCSFSDTTTHYQVLWPEILKNIIKPTEFISRGKESQGNGMIARQIVYEVSQQETTDDLLVGVMWSGQNRNEIYFRNNSRLKKLGFGVNQSSVSKEHPGTWLLQNHNWKDPISRAVYSMFDEHFAQIKTYEWILHTQMFLEKHNIKYFMMCYTSRVLDFVDDPVCKHLVDAINWDTFITKEGCYEWCRDKSGLPIPEPQYAHPSPEQHELFTKQVIVPWLKTKKYI